MSVRRCFSCFSFQISGKSAVRNVSTSIFNSLFNNEAGVIKKFFTEPVSCLPQFENLGQCLSFTNHSFTFADVRKNVKNTFCLAFTDDPYGVLEEITSSCSIKDGLFYANGRKYWCLRPNDQQIQSYITVLSQQDGTKCVVELDTSINGGIEETQVPSFKDPSCTFFNLELQIDGCPIQSLSLFDNGDDIANELRQRYWLYCACLLVSNCRQRVMDVHESLPTNMLADCLSSLYALETVLATHQTQLDNSVARKIFADSVAVKCIVYRALTEIYQMVALPLPSTLKYFSNFYGNNNSLSLHCVKRLCKQYWFEHHEAISDQLPDSELTNMNIFYAAKPDRKVMAKVRDLKTNTVLFSAKDCPFINQEINTMSQVCGDLDWRIIQLRSLFVDALKQEAGVRMGADNNNGQQRLFYHHYLQNQLSSLAQPLFVSMCVLNRLNHIMSHHKHIFNNTTQFETEKVWAFNTLEKSFLQFDYVMYKTTRFDVHFKETQSKAQGKITSDRRQLQFVHAMFPSFA